jgi:hypothetical protein
MKTDFVPLYPPEKAAFKVAVAVVDDSSTDPYERVGRQTLWSRRIRAAVVSGTGTLVEECVLHVPTENLGESSGGDLDRRWAVIREMMHTVGTGGAFCHFPELIAPGEEDRKILPPLVYCSVPKAFFALPCPNCLEPMQTCRDDAFLAKLGLPLFSTSSTRFLVCPKCAESESSPTVVDTRANTSVPESKARLLKASEYMEQISQTLAEKRESKGARSFCCARCSERDQCWEWSGEDGEPLEIEGLEASTSISQGPRWRVFTTHGVPFIVTRPAMVPLEVFIQMIRSEATPTTEGAATAGHGNLLFSFDGSGMDAVEILALRLTAFGQAVRAVREHHKTFERAHLDISSESLVVATPRPGCGLPALWNFGVRLEATSAVDTLHLGNEVSVPVPPHDPVAPFFSPKIREFLLTGHRLGELQLDSLRPESDGLWRIEGRLVDPRGVFPKPGTQDWVKLQWTEDPSGLGVDKAAARVDPRGGKSKNHKGIPVTTEPLQLAESAVERVTKAGGVVLPGVTYRVYPHFGPQDDLYSLGMVLFLCVMVNDTQDLGLISDDLGLLGLDQNGQQRWKDRAREQVARHPNSWGPNAVHFDAVDRTSDRPNAIPEDLWIETLVLALRMVAADPDLYVENEGGPALFAKIEAEVECIVRQLRAVLFDRQPLHLEIQSVISELLSAEEQG